MSLADRQEVHKAAVLISSRDQPIKYRAAQQQRKALGDWLAHGLDWVVSRIRSAASARVNFRNTLVEAQVVSFYFAEDAIDLPLAVILRGSCSRARGGHNTSTT